MIRDELTRLIQEGYKSLGELIFEQFPGGYRLYHESDKDRLHRARKYSSPRDAREIAKYDANGIYRPLKGAPNLATGWLIEVATIDELKQALDLFYPGAIASWMTYRTARANPINFRQTLNRQSGRYRLTRKLTAEQARILVRVSCDSRNRCLRTILWGIEENEGPDFLARSKSDPEVDQTGLGRKAVPYLCLEACNLLVAKARDFIKNPSE